MTMIFYFDGFESTKPFTKPITKLVLHWTAGVGDDPLATAGIMRRTKSPKGGTSVHHIVSKSGKYLQTSAEYLQCRHAGGVNDHSIGIEVSCPGIQDGAPYQSQPMDWPIYTDTIRGNVEDLVDYRPEQYAVLEWLIPRICKDHNIPLKVPRLDGKLRRTAFKSLEEQAAFSGIIGHFHVFNPSDKDKTINKNRKYDPGIRPMQWLITRFGA